MRCSKQRLVVHYCGMIINPSTGFSKHPLCLDSYCGMTIPQSRSLSGRVAIDTYNVILGCNGHDACRDRLHVLHLHRCRWNGYTAQDTMSFYFSPKAMCPQTEMRCFMDPRTFGQPALKPVGRWAHHRETVKLVPCYTIIP